MLTMPDVPTFGNDGKSCVACGGRLTEVRSFYDSPSDQWNTRACTRCGGLHVAALSPSAVLKAGVDMTVWGAGEAVKFFAVRWLDSKQQLRSAHGWTDSDGRMVQSG